MSESFRNFARVIDTNHEMNENFAIQLFEGNKVRIVWDAEQEKYYFAVADIVQVLTDSADGKVYKPQAADLKGIFRIIESIPSKKAEPVRQWLAEVGAQRIDQMIDPELTFQMAVEDYRRPRVSALPRKVATWQGMPVRRWSDDLTVPWFPRNALLTISSLLTARLMMRCHLKKMMNE